MATAENAKISGANFSKFLVSSGHALCVTLLFQGTFAVNGWIL